MGARMTKRIDGKIKVEAGVPVPCDSPHQKYPWAAMEVGDSFFAPCSPSEIRRLRNNLRNGAAQWALRRGGGRRFFARPHGDGVRVWRIA
jgi:hypothetical protein